MSRMTSHPHNMVQRCSIYCCLWLVHTNMSTQSTEKFRQQVFLLLFCCGLPHRLHFIAYEPYVHVSACAPTSTPLAVNSTACMCSTVHARKRHFLRQQLPHDDTKRPHVALLGNRHILRLANCLWRHPLYETQSTQPLRGTPAPTDECLSYSTMFTYQTSVCPRHPSQLPQLEIARISASPACLSQ